MAMKQMMLCDGIADGIACENSVAVSVGAASRDYWSEAPDKKWLRVEVRTQAQTHNTSGTKTFCSWECFSTWAAHVAATGEGK